MLVPALPTKFQFSSTSTKDSLDLNNTTSINTISTMTTQSNLPTIQMLDTTGSFSPILNREDMSTTGTINPSNAAPMTFTFDQSSTVESDSHVHSSSQDDADVTMCICPVCGFSASSPRGQDEHMELAHGEANSPSDKIADCHPKSYTIQSSSPDDRVTKLSLQASSTPHHSSRWSTTLRNLPKSTEKLAFDVGPNMNMTSPQPFTTSSGTNLVVRSQSGRHKTYSCSPNTTEVKMKKVDSRRRYRCNICPATFPWHGDLTEHLRLAHGMQKSRENARSGKAGSFYCSHCKYVAKYQSELKRHMRLHWGVKPFICVFCPYRSAWKGDLKRHMESHHRERFSSETELIKIMSQFKNNAGTMINGNLNQPGPHPDRIHDPVDDVDVDDDDEDVEGRGDKDTDAYSFSKESDLSLTGPGEDRKSVDEDLAALRLMIRSRKTERLIRDISSPIRPGTNTTMSNCSGQSEGSSADGRAPTMVMMSSKSNEISQSTVDNRLTCEICTYKAQNQSKFMNHMASHINARQFQCPICDQRSNYKWDIKKHLKKHHPDLAQMPIRVLYTNEIPPNLDEKQQLSEPTEPTDISNPATVLLFAAAAAAAVAAAAAGATPATSTQGSMTNRPCESYSTTNFITSKTMPSTYPSASVGPTNTDVSPVCLISTSSSSSSYPSLIGLRLDSNLNVNNTTSPLSPGPSGSRLWSNPAVMTPILDSQDDSAMPIDLSKSADHNNSNVNKTVAPTSFGSTGNFWTDCTQVLTSSSTTPPIPNHHHPLSNSNSSAFSSFVQPSTLSHLGPTTNLAVSTFPTGPQPINLTASCLTNSSHTSQTLVQRSFTSIGSNNNNNSTGNSNGVFLHLNNSHQNQQEQQQIVLNSLVQSWQQQQQQQKACLGPSTTLPSPTLFSNRGLPNPSMITTTSFNLATASTTSATVAPSCPTVSANVGNDCNDYSTTSWDQGGSGLISCIPRSLTPCLSTNRSDANSTPNRWSPSGQDSDWPSDNHCPTGATIKTTEQVITRRRTHIRGRKPGSSTSYNRTVGGMGSSGSMKEEQWKRHQCSGCGHRSNWKWDINKHIKVAHPERTNITTLTLDLDEAKRTFSEYMNRVKLSRNRYLNESVNGSLSQNTGSWSGNCPSGAIGPYGPIGEGYYRPYKCSVCGHRSNWKWDVRKHIKQMHSGAAEIITLSLEEARRTIHQYKNRRRHHHHHHHHHHHQDRRHLAEPMDNKPDLAYSSSESNHPSPSTSNLAQETPVTNWPLATEPKTQYTLSALEDGDDDTNSPNPVQSSPLNLVISPRSSLPPSTSHDLTTGPEFVQTRTTTRLKSRTPTKRLFAFKCRFCKHHLGTLKALFVHLAIRRHHQHVYRHKHRSDCSNSFSSKLTRFRRTKHSFVRFGPISNSAMTKPKSVRYDSAQILRHKAPELEKFDPFVPEKTADSESGIISEHSYTNPSLTIADLDDKSSIQFVQSHSANLENPLERRFVTKNLIECERRLAKLVTSSSGIFNQNSENSTIFGSGTRPLTSRWLATNQLHSNPLKLGEYANNDVDPNRNDDQYEKSVHHLAQLLDEVMNLLKAPSLFDCPEQRTKIPTDEFKHDKWARPRTVKSTISDQTPPASTTANSNTQVMHYLTDMIRETVSKNENINYSDSFINSSSSSNEENQESIIAFSKTGSVYKSHKTQTIQQILQHPDIQGRFLTLATILHHVSGCCTKPNSPG